jgi:hypothetical protein
MRHVANTGVLTLGINSFPLPRRPEIATPDFGDWVAIVSPFDVGGNLS